MCHRRLTGSVLLLGGCLLFAAERSCAASKPEVIATSSSAPPPSGAIQQAVFVADSPMPGPLAGPQPTPSAPMPAPVGPMEAAPTPPPAPKPPETAPAAPSSAAAMVSVEVTGPSRMALGQPLTHEIVLRNTGGKAVSEVHVEEPLPAGVRALRSDPPAVTRDSGLSWDLGPLQAGAEKRLKVELQPAGPGELHLRPRVVFQSGEGLHTQVVQPPFGVEMTTDRAKVVRGERVAFRLRVFNRGDAPVRNVKLYDTLPEGLQHPAGKVLGITNLGDLLPGETRPFTLEVTAMQAGNFRNELVAQADGGIEAKTSLSVQVTEPILSLRVEGPKQGVTQRDLDFRVELINPGPATAQRPRLVQTLPPTFLAVAASTGATFDADRHALVWSLSDLVPKQRQVLTFRIKATAAGDWPLYTAVLTENLPETRSANVIHLEGAPMLKLEVRAREEQVGVGGETVYALHVFNQGDAPCPGVRLTAALPGEVTPLSVEGPASGQVENQQVRFAPLDKLPPRGEAVYRIHVRGRQPGKGHVRVELMADKQPSVQSEVSIQVNGGPAPPSGAQTVGHTNPVTGQKLR